MCLIADDAVAGHGQPEAGRRDHNLAAPALRCCDRQAVNRPTMDGRGRRFRRRADAVARAGYAEEWKFPIVDRLETYVLARAAA